jgi:GMP synthase-like glutamine amidotransferase
MKILLIDNGTKLINELCALIPGHEYVVRPYEIGDIKSTEFDLIVLSGSSTSSVIFDGASFQNEVSLIRESTTPVIGICFGCELIAHAYGGTLNELSHPHTGIREIQFHGNELTEKERLNVYEHHRWILTGLPNEFEVLATSSDGIEAFRHRERPLYGLQFHPEKCGDDTETHRIFERLVAKLA